VKKPAPIAILLLLGVACLCLATVIQPRAAHWLDRGDAASVWKVIFGDGRRIFANHFFVKADVIFHSGYYPSIFDSTQAPKDSKHMTTSEGEPEAEEHERKMNFLGPPKDWIEAFGRNFLVTEHTHLENGNEKEILPWLRLSAEMDPQRIDTYTVAAYWLRSRLGKVDEAERFLRDGLRANPRNPELLFELGVLEYENHNDMDRARNLWELSLRRWQEQAAGQKDPDLTMLEKIAIHLARLEEKTGNLKSALHYLELAQKVSPNAEGMQKEVEEMKAKVSALPPAPAPAQQ
jgi:tetratricopeptide (TPR) repeat protein